MTRGLALQIAAGLGTVLALPLLYVGLTRDITGLVVLGFVVFGASMAVTPILRLTKRG
jgi:hypothetical protein